MIFKGRAVLRKEVEQETQKVGEQVILAADGYGTQCSFGSVVIDLEAAVIAIGQKRSPAPESVADCSGNS